ncbi:MAG TPA: glucoamylase family protein [Chryseolinea sp.]
MYIRKLFFFLIVICSLQACSDDDADKTPLELQHIFMGSTEIKLTGGTQTGLPVDRPISLSFSAPVDRTSAANGIRLSARGQTVNTQLSYSSEDKIVVLSPVGTLAPATTYTVEVTSNLKSAAGQPAFPATVDFTTTIGPFTLLSGQIGGQNIEGTDRIMEVPLALNMVFEFSSALDESTLAGAAVLSGPGNTDLLLALSNGNKTLTITSVSPLQHISKFSFRLSTALKGAEGQSFQGLSEDFYTAVDETPKFPVISDDALLSLVQQQTFKYFWDFAHPTSGLARERNTSGDIVTSGGSGFGIMAIIVGIERDFITRGEGVQRMNKMVAFLEDADRFHGAWPHWINGSTGDVIPFSAKDDGGDLVETSFLMQGLLTFRQYLQPSDTIGNNLIKRINALWEAVEWDWYRKNNENVLYWHWSPNYNWEMNFAMYGYFEEQITYVLAAASPTHSIPKTVYTSGYGQNGSIVTGNTYYNYVLPLGTPSPLFWVHYSYLGLDPHFTDDYANYWTQKVNASLINYAYCVDNPKNFVGYSDACWGLTSSDDDQNGYDAHSPSNDLGVITPTAALSSFPYTPDASMKALKFFYYTLGDRLWGNYGFYDAFNLTSGWTANSYLAIDQGPIIVMIENYRTGLLWELFMSAPEVQAAKTKLNLK